MVVRSKADETFVIVETLICPLQISHPFENVSCQGRIQIFFREGAPILVTFSSVAFFDRYNFKQRKYQKRL